MHCSTVPTQLGPLKIWYTATRITHVVIELSIGELLRATAYNEFVVTR
jgi:hypothetical protein